MKNRSLLAVLSAITLIATVAINSVANIIPFNGVTTGEISDSFPIAFVPAGYVFSIWSVIYIGLALYTVFEWKQARSLNPKTSVRVPQLFILSNILNAGWIYCWHYGYYTITLLLMVGMLLSLIAIYKEIRKKDIFESFQTIAQLAIPFSIYLGWISVATIANVSVLLIRSNWDGFGIADGYWAAIMVVVATILGMLMIIREKDSVYPLVLIWSFIGIYIKHSSNSDVSADIATLQWTTVVTSILLVVSILWLQINKRKK